MFQHKPEHALPMDIQGLQTLVGTLPCKPYVSNTGLIYIIKQIAWHLLYVNTIHNSIVEKLCCRKTIVYDEYGASMEER